MQSHPLRRTHFSQYQASSAAVGWPGDWDCYIMHRMQSGDWPYSETPRKCKQSSLVHIMWEGLGTKLVAIWPWKFSLVLGTKPAAFVLVPRPSTTPSLQHVKQMMASYPGPILHKCRSRIALFPTNVTSTILPKQKCWGWWRPGNEARLAQQVIKNWKPGELWNAYIGKKKSPICESC